MKPIIIPDQITLDVIKEQFAYDPETGGLIRTTKYNINQIKKHTIVNDHHMTVWQIAWFLMKDIWADHFIDHIDHNRKNNRWNNLQAATQSENMANRSKAKGSSSKYKGVSWANHKWKASFRPPGSKMINLGTFDDEIEAAKAYDVAASKVEEWSGRVAMNFIGDNCLFTNGAEAVSSDSPYAQTIVSVEDRFWSKVNKNGKKMDHMEDECWEWVGAADKEGWYGRLKIDGKTKMAHRVSYELAFGKIDDDKWILHRCDNPACVRSSHLFLGTPQDNAIDMWEKGRAYDSSGSKNGNAGLNDEQVSNIIREYEKQPYGSKMKEYNRLADKYETSWQSIYRIINNKTYKDVII